MKQITLTKPQPRYTSGWNLLQFKDFTQLHDWTKEINPGNCSVNIFGMIYSYVKDWRG